MISIIIPSFDRADLLELTLNSVIKQKYVEFEIIVIDDNSKSKEIFNLCQKFDVHYLRNEKNSGAQFSRNKGVDFAKYEFIAFIDSDDMWENEDKLFKQLNILIKNEKISIVFTNLNFIDINNKLMNKENLILNNKILNKEFPKVILEKDIIGTYSSVMIRKKDFINCGKCNLELPARQDWDLWIRLSKIGNAHFLDNIYTLYRIHDNQISSGILRKIDGFSKLLLMHKKYFFEINMKSSFYKHLFKLILLNHFSKEKNTSFETLYSEMKPISIIMKFLINCLLFIPISKKIILKKISKTYLFRGLNLNEK